MIFWSRAYICTGGHQRAKHLHGAQLNTDNYTITLLSLSLERSKHADLDTITKLGRYGSWLKIEIGRYRSWLKIEIGRYKSWLKIEIPKQLKSP